MKADSSIKELTIRFFKALVAGITLVRNLPPIERIKSLESDFRVLRQPIPNRNNYDRKYWEAFKYKKCSNPLLFGYSYQFLLG
jgi:hypothetical protein